MKHMKLREILTYGALYGGLILLFLASGYASVGVWTAGQYTDPSYEINTVTLSGLLIWGFILFFAGLIDWYNYFYKPKKEKQTTKVEVVGEKRADRYCPSCGRAIPFDAQLCPYCERRF